MGATRRNLRAQPKIIRKIIGTSNQPIKTQIFPKKNYVWYLKSVKEPKTRRLPDGIRPGSQKNNMTQVKFKKP
jgi:hypothetical protein